MKHDLTQQQKSLARTYLAYKLVSNMIFVSAVWLYFYRLFITDAQIGILDALAFAIGVIAEVPSGVLADKYGRARTAKFGLLLSGIGAFIQSFGSSFFPFCFGQSVLMIGLALVSGADEALFFSKLGFDRRSSHWKKLVMRGSQVALIGALAATLLGGWAHTINPRLPWFLVGMVELGAILLLWRVKDPHKPKERLSLAKGLHGHVKEIKEGFAQFHRPELFRYVPFILTVSGLFYTASPGLLRIVLLDRFHFNPLAGSFLVAGCSFLTFIALSLVHFHASKVNEKHVFMLIGASAAIALVLSVFDIGLWGGLVILALYAGDRILYPFMSEIINNNAREELRATTLSVASFLKALPYVALAPLIGSLNTNGNLDYFLLSWPILIIGAVLFYLVRKGQTQVPDED